MMQHQNRRAREAFTLIELLVVIAIIAILVSLTSAAVMKVLWKGPEMVTRNDITACSHGIGAFQQEFNVKYMPSQFVLRSDLTTYNMGNQVEADSKNFLQMMFGNRIGLQAGTGAKILINWNGTGAAGPITLSGDQCLVFFLGGIPVTGATPGCQGFSTDPTNPAAATTTRRGPFYDFKSNRLTAGANGFFSYIDGYGRQPYAYFSAYKRANGYNPYGSSDCPSLIPGGPYALSSTVFINSNSYQIISAGQDTAFGPGGTTWNPSTGFAPGGPGADDFCNFSSARMGTSQQ